MQTPAPLIWKFWDTVGNRDGVGGVLHYYDESAQTVTPDSGIVEAHAAVPEGDWEGAEWSDDKTIDSTPYEMLDLDHPSRGAWYGAALLPTAGTEPDKFYLLRYEYEKRLDSHITGTWQAQTDNPITQINLSVTNLGRKAFLSEGTMFAPGARIEIGVVSGKSGIYQIGQAYIDEINYDILSDTVSVSGRNTCGYMLASQTFDADSVISGRISECVTGILAYFGVTNQAVEVVEEEISLKFDAGTTGLAALQQIAEHLSEFDSTRIEKLWRIGETPEGKIVCGYQDFFSNFIATDNYIFDLEHEVFRYSVNRCVDNAYTKVRMTGTDEDGEPLEPVVWSVPHDTTWRLGEHRTYQSTVDGVTQEQLSAMGTNNALMLAHTGDVSSVSMSIRPQLVIGDYAKIRFADGETEDMGIITSITHKFGKTGFTTDLTVDKAGHVWSDGGHVITRNLSINGSSRKSTLADYFAKKKG